MAETCPSLATLGGSSFQLNTCLGGAGHVGGPGLDGAWVTEPFSSDLPFGTRPLDKQGNERRLVEGGGGQDKSELEKAA